MVFSSLTFICVFLPIVFLAYLAIPNMKAKNWLLIAASLVFYAYGEPVYVLLMLASSFVNYIFGRLISRFLYEERGKHSGVSSTQPKKAKIVVAISVIVNLAFLGVFKYAGMFIQTADSLFGLALTIPGIALPIGISFYTFEAISYVIDVYRGEVTSTRSFPKMLLFISFFPHLIAGPILKYHDVDAQLDSRVTTVTDIAAGMRRFTVGLGKKVLIANTMAVAADSVFSANLADINIVIAWIGALAYIMQIYFDFSGYSDMAIGLARMFGFHYKENFNYPYISSSIQEFWRRWHISLSTWFKEYLYFPLGGNRKGKARAGLNKVIVFFCCGLWHGASWTFVIWGLFHGLFLLLEEYIPVKRLPKALGVIYALLVVTVGFVLFRADSIGQAWYVITQMFTGFHFESACTSLALQQLTPLFIFMFIIAVVACMPVKNWFASFMERWKSRPLAALTANGGEATKASEANIVDQNAFDSTIAMQEVPEAAEHALAKRQAVWNGVKAVSYVLAIVLLFVCIVSLSGGGYNPFIYFRF